MVARILIHMLSGPARRPVVKPCQSEPLPVHGKAAVPLSAIADGGTARLIFARLGGNRVARYRRTG